MKRIMVAVFFLILASSAFAAIYEAEIFSKSVTDSGTYTASNGENFTIGLYGNDISVDLPDRSIIVKNGSCETSGLYEICLSITEFSHYNYSLPERIVNKRDITIKTRLAKLNLSRNFEKKSFWIGEETVVTMRIQNLGDRPTTAEFLDNVSDAFDVALPLLCKAKGNAVTWKGKLEKNEVVTCEYRITAVKEGSFSSSATAAYESGTGEATETHSETLTVKDYPLQVNVTLSNNSVKLGGNVTATFTITTTSELTIQALRIRLPEGLRPISWKGASMPSDGTLSYDKSSPPGGEDQFEIVMRAERTGTFSIIEEANFKLTEENIYLDYERGIEVNVSVGELYTRFLKSEFETGDNKLNVFIVNPTNQDFSNVELTLQTELPLASKTASFDEVTLLGHQEFSSAFNAAPGTYPVTTRIKYASKYGENFIVTEEGNITIAGEVQEMPAPEPEPEAPQQPTTTPTQQVQEPEQEPKIKKSPFSFVALVIVIVIVALLGGIIMLISIRRKQKRHEEEWGF